MNRHSWIRGPLSLILGAALAACSSSDTAPKTTSGACDTDNDCASGICIAGTCVTGGDSGPDARGDASDGGRDTPAPLDTGARDATTDDTPSPGDTTNPGDAPPPRDTDADVAPGAPLSPCTSNGECLSGYCVDWNEGRVCTALCVQNEDCFGPDWRCVADPRTGSETLLLCLPVPSTLCRTCTTSAECGGFGARCVGLELETVCAPPCETADDCPEGFACDSTTVDGTTARLCLPTLGTCGDCFDRDGDDYGEGPGCSGVDCNDDDPNIRPGAPESCDTIDNDCDDQIDEDFDLQTSVQNCGACGTSCTALNGTPACVAGACAIATCNAGWFDIDGRLDNGCEYECTPTSGAGQTELCNGLDDDCDGTIDEGFDLQGDNRNCGACGAICNPANGVGQCVAGTCNVVACFGQFFDCDQQASNGCETNILSSLNNCGGCGTICALDNADEVCVNGLCQVAQCSEGYGNCNFDPSDGCEANTKSSLQHCGRCNSFCNLANAGEACVDGLCEVTSCEPGYGDCDGLGENGCEVRVDADVNNCGTCGTFCALDNATPRCDRGLCRVQSCVSGFGDCNTNPEDGCEVNLDADAANCRTCGNACSYTNGIAGCQGGSCFLASCQPGWLDLDGQAFNGCEYACVPTSPVDDPDPQFLDANCDGIDGDYTKGVFVSPTGNDTNTGDAPSRPLRTIQAAIQKADVGPLAGRTQIYLLEGTYNESITLRSGISIYGGYRAFGANWGRGPYSSAQSILNGNTVAVVANGLVAPTRVSNMILRSASAFESGESSYVVRVIDSGPNLLLEDVEITAGNGANGSAGVAGDAGSSGNAGGNGQIGCSGCSGNGGGGGGGGSPCGNNGGGGGTGGYGSSGGSRGADGGGPLGGSGGGGGGGRGDQTCALVFGNCSTAGTGGTGQASRGAGAQGTHGPAGNGQGSVVNGVWTPSSGGLGAQGQCGSGGGGGGGGGGTDCCDDDRGGGGGGGGGGGSGGTGGRGGTGGGGSFGVFVVNSNPTLARSVVRAGRGGNGGNGGNGGTGGSGGIPGSGGTGQDDSGPGGTGGAGGTGGRGGCGGGGGGGISFALYRVGGATAVVSSTNLSTGQPGSGGAPGCEGGNAGAVGASGGSN